MLKLLLIEDDPDLAQLIASALEKEHYSVDLCSDGETGLLYALNPDYGYDLAIIDRMLPVIDGLSIVRAMRRKGIQLPVLVITALGGLDDRVEGLDGGADDYLVKPFHLRELSGAGARVDTSPADISRTTAAAVRRSHPRRSSTHALLRRRKSPAHR